MYDDLQEALHYGKQAYKYINDIDVNSTYGDMDGHCTFVLEWFKEDVPIEDKDGTSLAVQNRKMMANAICSEPGPTPKVDPPAKEEILVFADQAGMINQMLEKAPEGRIGTKKVVSKPCSVIEA